ncbi:MAG: DUF3368 domain-containing protein [Chloroflexi bacterium]|nr:DUF3368 domain-containing protein [Chloroflexota bacterium]
MASNLDDGAARKCAQIFAIPTKGTLAVVIRAKRYGFISSAADILRQLKSHGFRIDEHFWQILPTVGENW